MSAESWRGKIDEDCCLGRASCGTVLWKGQNLTVHRLEVECAAVPAAPGNGGVTVIGTVCPRAAMSCHSALAWLTTHGPKLLPGALLPWRGMGEGKGHPSLRMFFAVSPLDLFVEEQHLEPTFYLAVVAAMTGWAQDPEVGGMRAAYPLHESRVHADEVVA